MTSKLPIDVCQGGVFLSSFIDIIVRGGPLMIAIVFCTVVSLAIISKRLLRLRRAIQEHREGVLGAEGTKRNGFRSGFQEASPVVGIDRDVRHHLQTVHFLTPFLQIRD